MITIVDGHAFVSESRTRNGFINNNAGCECGVQYDWGVREEQHDQHVLSIVRSEGAKAGYETARQDMISGAFIGGPTYEALKASQTGKRIAAEAFDKGWKARAERDKVAWVSREKQEAPVPPKSLNPYKE